MVSKASGDSINFVQGIPIFLEKNWGYFSLFRVFWDVSVNSNRNLRFGQYEVCASKKKKSS